jgi:hypothetical protein
MKICPVGAELIHADVSTHMKKLIGVFCNSANVLKKTHKTIGSESANYNSRYLMEDICSSDVFHSYDQCEQLSMQCLAGFHLITYFFQERFP